MQSATRYNDRNPKFIDTDSADSAADNVCWSFPVHEAASQNLTLQLWDADNWSDDFVATATLSIASLEPGAVRRTWLPLTPEDEFAAAKYDGKDAQVRVEALWCPFDKFARQASTGGAEDADDSKATGETAVLELPHDWELPPSGVLTVAVRRVCGLPQLLGGGGGGCFGGAADDLDPLRLQPRVRLTLGSRSYKTHIAQVICGHPIDSDLSSPV